MNVKELATSMVERALESSRKEGPQLDMVIAIVLGGEDGMIHASMRTRCGFIPPNETTSAIPHDVVEWLLKRLGLNPAFTSVFDKPVN